MTEKTERAFGLWDSPLTPAGLSKSIGLGEPAWDTGGALVWQERRADRAALVVLPPGEQAPRDLNSTFSVRGGVGYGGGAFAVGQGMVYFVEARFGRIYCQPLAGGEPARALTPGFGDCAAPVLSADGRWLLFIRSYEGEDTLEIVATHGRAWPQKLIAGDDFVMQPAWHPQGQMIAWIAWNHPNMPWDGTELRLGRLVLSPQCMPALDQVQTLAGDADTSIFQPEFSPDGRYIAYVSDASGWWQIYLYDLESGETRQLTQVEAEHGLPAWVQGMRTYAFAPEGRSLYVLRNRDARVTLWQIDVETGREQLVPLEPEYTLLEQIQVGEAGIALIASGSRTPARLIVRRLPSPDAGGPDAGGLDAGGLGAGEPEPPDSRIVRRSSSEELASTYSSQPEIVEWNSPSGDPAYGLFYPPHNPRFTGTGLPPLIVSVHGGPTGQAMLGFDSEVQFYTSRGWAFLEVNFRGSSGYGRDYRNLLRGNWGVYDIEDAAGGARHLVETSRVDPGKLVILGGSSGGYAVLKALEDYPGFFKAGVCRYGISNLLTLVQDTHKFELHYFDRLIGPLPEAVALYRERSPIFFADRIQDPLALFHGEDDASVPRDQLDALVAVLRRRGVPHEVHVYPGEGHGFCKPETIEHYYKTVEQFLRQYVVWG